MSSFLANLRPQAATGQTSIQATLANSSQVPQTPGNQVSIYISVVGMLTFIII